MRHRQDFFDGPDRAVRFAHGLHGRHHHGRPPRFFGALLLASGVLFLLDALNILEARAFIRAYWPAILVVWGGMQVIFGRGGGRVFGATVATIGAVLLGVRLSGWDIQLWRLLAPLLMIGFGIHILLHPRRRVAPPAPDVDGEPAPQPEVDASAQFEAAAVTATVHRKIVSQALQGGAASAVVGGLELDLRDCRMAGDSATVTIRIVMGEVVLRIPRDWTVANHVSATLANIENHTDAPVDTGSKRLVLEGSAVLGNVEVRN